MEKQARLSSGAWGEQGTPEIAIRDGGVRAIRGTFLAYGGPLGEITEQGGRAKDDERRTRGGFRASSRVGEGLQTKLCNEPGLDGRRDWEIS